MPAAQLCQKVVMAEAAFTVETTNQDEARYDRKKRTN